MLGVHNERRKEREVHLIESSNLPMLHVLLQIKMETVDRNRIVCVCVPSGEAMIRKTWQSVAVFASFSQ